MRIFFDFRPTMDAEELINQNLAAQKMRHMINKTVEDLKGQIKFDKEKSAILVSLVNGQARFTIFNLPQSIFKQLDDRILLLDTAESDSVED